MAAVHNCGIELVDHPPHAPDLATSDYFLFPNMKKHLAGKQYWMIMRAYLQLDFFKDQIESFYNSGIQALQHGGKKCVDRRGDYVEKLITIGQISQPMNSSAHGECKGGGGVCSRRGHANHRVRWLNRVHTS